MDNLIRFPKVLVIDNDGTSLGEMSSRDAMMKAREKNLNLLCVAPSQNDPADSHSKDSWHDLHFCAPFSPFRISLADTVPLQAQDRKPGGPPAVPDPPLLPDPPSYPSPEYKPASPAWE